MSQFFNRLKELSLKCSKKENSDWKRLGEHKKNKFVKGKKESAEMRKKIEENRGWCRKAGKRERKKERETARRDWDIYTQRQKKEEMLLEELKHLSKNIQGK